MANPKPKRKKILRTRDAAIKAIDVQDIAAIEALGVRGLRQFAKINNIQIPRACVKREEVLYSILTYLEKLYGKDPINAGPKPKWMAKSWTGLMSGSTKTSKKKILIGRRRSNYRICFVPIQR